MAISKANVSSLIAALLAMWPAVAGAQTATANYPTQPIKLVVPFPAGGGADTLARIVTKYMADDLGQGFILLNVPGAGGALGFEQVARAAPDGYTLIWTSVGFAIMAATIKGLKFDPARDFAHVSQIGQNPFVLVVNPKVAATSVSELVALAKAKPGTLNFANNGNGTLTNLVVELMKLESHIDVVQVAYRGDNFSIADVLAGHVDAMFSNSPVSMPHVLAGKLRALAVTSPKRLAALADLPTMSESGFPGFEAVVWQGMSAPAATPRPVLERLHRAVRFALRQPEVDTRFADLGSEHVGSSPDEFSALITRELKVWADVVHRAGVKVE